MSLTIQTPKDIIEYESEVGDEHPLSYKAREYAETEFKENYSTKLVGGEHPTKEGELYPDLELDLSKIIWETSTTAKSRHGVAKYIDDDVTKIVLSEYTFDKGGFESMKTVIRHELAHAFQHQYMGWDMNINTGKVTWLQSHNDATVQIDTGHTGSFEYFVNEWDLDGRTASHYNNKKEDYKYILECPHCGKWYGRHRYSKVVKQTAIKKRLCGNCESVLYISNSDEEALHHLSRKTQSDTIKQIVKQFTNGEEVDQHTFKNIHNIY